MSAPVFLVDDAADLHAGSTTSLEGPEGRHAATVLRLRPGEQVMVTDGRGSLGAGTVSAVGRDRLDVLVSAVDVRPAAQPRLIVVQALPKGDRGELAVATMTEVGADVIVPWAAARCVVRWEGARGERALAGWRTTGREAAKQARRSWFPEVVATATTAEVAARLTSADVAVVLHEEASEPLVGLEVPRSGDVAVVVGPEGGIAPDELELFRSVGGRQFRLGPTVLRTSTAGPAALAVLLAKTARWA